MESTQYLPDDKTQAPDVKEDPTLSRILLSRVLIEEYESLAQPPLNETELKEFQTFKDQQSCDGNTVKSIYRIFRSAQQRYVKKIRAELEDKYNKQIPDDTLRQQVVNQAVLAAASGENVDVREECNTQLAEVPAAETGPETEALVQNKIVEIFKKRPRVSSAEADRMAGKTLRSALCLSGGGIRSATFNLGILQGLARHGLLDKFDYLSTVSGGGFIGGWLTAWKHRSGLPKVVNELRNPPDSPLDPDPKPVEHLRIYSNYLSPQPGLLSADTWTLIATLLRNLLLNWFVFVPVLLALLLLPRMWASIVLRSGFYPQYAITWSYLIGFVAAVVALSYIARNLPSSNKYDATPSETSSEKRYKVRQGPFIIGCLIWLVISAAALSVFLWKWQVLQYRPFLWWEYALFAAAIITVPWIICIIKVWRNTAKDIRTTRRFYTVLITATVLIYLAQIIVGYIAGAMGTVVLPIFYERGAYDQGILYSIFSTPLVLLLMGFEAVLITGFTSRLSNDDDQEWWARAGAWVLIVVVAWILVHSLVLYGPLLLLTLKTRITELTAEGGDLRQLRWGDWAKLAATVLGILSGVITLVGGFSAKTPANSKEAQKAGKSGLLLGLLTQVLAPVFLAFLIILLSLGTNWILISRPFQFISYEITGEYLVTPVATASLSEWHCMLIKTTLIWLLVIFFGLLLMLGVVMGRLISTNVFSLQYLWRNRIIRAYLGASHVDRRPNAFTNFDSYDNLHMHKLWPQPVPSPAIEALVDPDKPEEPFTKKLFHVLNMALNLTGGVKVQWQDRKAESFTVSPLHAGSYWLGYRRSTHYGGRDGITLGASVAISGAFVSPNMGYMMSSPIVRFLMALFNIRFGWWLGNPGPAGDKTNAGERLLNVGLKLLGFEVKRPFRLDSPRFSVLPFLSEATGNIDDQSSYVYLSDGGHFENLGLYEMVLRRCRFIVVCDATTDPDYSFESLAMSIRQIRVDLGVPIDIPELAVGVPSQNLKSKYCAAGTIRYSCVDRNPDDKNTCDDDFDGILIFIKPSLIGQEPRDVINYWQGRSTFPQEVITDQWFTEAQFESYRALGSYIIDAICGDSRNRINLPTFAQKVRDHNLLNFDAFQEQISYFALTEAFKAGMPYAPADSYRAKVKKFMENILR